MSKMYPAGIYNVNWENKNSSQTISCGFKLKEAVNSQDQFKIHMIRDKKFAKIYGKIDVFVGQNPIKLITKNEDIENYIIRICDIDEHEINSIISKGYKIKEFVDSKCILEKVQSNIC